ncbi:uncharacterized protein LOC108866195 isoform X2 [Pyrus x bretschneideri]|uniref:uncharacterized protein LOC108866195 isoform X2 n=1 Tax=Pyrus x bretschneideri TaxID=225117 RepID=UPI00202EA3EC|nr:uncharacterized protein LOC108866195 isoform X2 [Pyrus x bretschneideri]
MRFQYMSWWFHSFWIWATRAEQKRQLVDNVLMGRQLSGRTMIYALFYGHAHFLSMSLIFPILFFLFFKSRYFLSHSSPVEPSGMLKWLYMFDVKELGCSEGLREGGNKEEPWEDIYNRSKNSDYGIWVQLLLISR